MKINSYLLRDLSKYDYLLEGINCISFFTYWDLMVFPGWRAYMNAGEKISLKVYKHKNLVILNDFISEIKKTKEMCNILKKLEISNSL